MVDTIYLMVTIVNNILVHISKLPKKVNLKNSHFTSKKTFVTFYEDKS